MNGSPFFRGRRPHVLTKALAVTLCMALALPVFAVTPAMAQVGTVAQTPATPAEIPIEVEIEVSPAGSLKLVPLWKEQYQLLTNPNAVSCTDPANPATCTSTIQRRPSFTATPLPPLNIWALDYNFLTGQPMRLRTSDGEVSLDQPGPLFDTGEVCTGMGGTFPCSELNTPNQIVRTIIGHIVACPNTPAYNYIPAGTLNAFCNGKPAGSLVVYNPDPPGPDGPSTLIPEHGTVVAVPAVVGGVLQELDGESTTATVDLAELEIPINEEDFFRPTTDTSGVPAPLRPYIGRRGAEILGKALFWDMQVGSDGVQACASCHFHAGVDNRTKGQLNPNTTNPDPSGQTLEVQLANTDVVASDFPFHKLVNPDLPGEGDPLQVVQQSFNDVMSSMGVSRFKLFNDIPAIGTFLPPVNGVAALAPDIGTLVADPVAVNQGLRRVEPRNTPTFHAAAFNFDNFWDGRARFTFNGGSVFGPSDPTAHIFIDPGNPGNNLGNLVGATNGHIRPELIAEGDPKANQPVRIKFSSLASQAVGPPLSDFEMSFAGRNWAKIGKKLLQGTGVATRPFVTPLANQLVAIDDSVLGPFSNQGGSLCPAGSTAIGKPGLCTTYPQLIQLAFSRPVWQNVNATGNERRHLAGAACGDPFDGYCLTIANGPANADDTNQFTQMEANFSLFFALAVQAYESLTIPDDTPWDKVNDLNPFLGQAVGEPADQAVLFPTLITDLIDDGILNGSTGYVNLGTTGVDADVVFGFDLFAGANLTAALAPGQTVGASGRDRNPLRTIAKVDFNGVPTGETVDIRVGSNPFTRSAKCMMCHLGPEQTDHSINIAHGLLKGDAEREFPTPPVALDDTLCIFGVITDPADPFFGHCTVPGPEPAGNPRVVAGLILAEEVEEAAQDAVEVEPRNFATIDDPATPWDDRIIAQESFFAFGDQGIYNIGLKPNSEDIGRGGNDPFGWPLSLAALALKNVGGATFEPCDLPTDSCVMANVDPNDLGATFDETGDGALFPNSAYDLQSINPGFERAPAVDLLPPYMAPWVGGGMPAGELHPQIDEMAGLAPNTITPPNGGPGIEYPEIIFGADWHCGRYDPATFGPADAPPNFGWGPFVSDALVCPNNQSGVPSNIDYPAQGTWPVPNRVLRNGAFKAPQLRNVELTGPFFHTGSFLTLRQVVDFYFRGGDFNETNKETRDPNVMNLFEMASSFGRSTGADLVGPFDCIGDPNLTQDPFNVVVDVACGPTFSYLAGNFIEGLPDTVFQFAAYPDSTHPFTPEPVFASRAEALEDAKNAIVTFLLALTDARVKYERAPFDHPELFVPIDGRAPENVAGRGTAPVTGGYDLVSQSGVACTLPLAGGLPEGPNPGPVCFRQIHAVGAGGNLVGPDGIPGTADDAPTPLPNFLGVTSIPPGEPGYNCSSLVGAVSHFCAVVNP